MKKHNWHIRAYEKGDEAGIVKLINTEQRQSKYNLSRWIWRYKKNPYGFLAVVSESDGEIVGHLAMCFLKMKVGNHTVMGSEAGDLFVDPNFRRQGMFLALGRRLAELATENNVVFSFIFPNTEAPYRGHVKYGYFDVQRIPTLVSYFDFHRATVEKTSRTVSVARQFSSLINYLHARKRKRLESNLSVTEAEVFSEEATELWKRNTREYGILVVREKEYLNWRFSECTEWKYKIFVAKDHDLKGFLVTSIHHVRKRKIGYIIDFFCDSEETFLQLVAHAISHFSEEFVDSVKCLENRCSHVLRQYGFSSLGQPKIRMCARINLPESSTSRYILSKLYEAYLPNLFINYGDFDFL